MKRFIHVKKKDNKMSRIISDVQFSENLLLDKLPLLPRTRSNISVNWLFFLFNQEMTRFELPILRTKCWESANLTYTCLKSSNSKLHFYPITVFFHLLCCILLFHIRNEIIKQFFLASKYEKFANCREVFLEIRHPKDGNFFK